MRVMVIELHEALQEAHVLREKLIHLQEGNGERYGLTTRKEIENAIADMPTYGQLFVIPEIVTNLLKEYPKIEQLPRDEDIGKILVTIPSEWEDCLKKIVEIIRNRRRRQDEPASID